MDKIKLRAWDATQKTMVYQDKCFPFTLITQYGLFRLDPHQKEDSYQKISREYVIMRGTGINAEKGKVYLIGKEIYEGDIFRHNKEINEIEVEGYSVVMWIPQRAAFYMVDVAHYEVLMANDCSKEKEFGWLFDDAALYDFSIDCGLSIVGNIYENPELLQ